MPHGEGDGTPLQYSCLENPRDGGAWWTAVYGVAQSRTQLKLLSISSSSSNSDISREMKKKKLKNEIKDLISKDKAYMKMTKLTIKEKQFLFFY